MAAANPMSYLDRAGRRPVRFLVGRAPDCFVQLAGTERDTFISRRHCKLVLDSPSVTVEDLNRTFVNIGFGRDWYLFGQAPTYLNRGCGEGCGEGGRHS